MTLRVIIVDDEKLAREMLKEVLEEYKIIDIVGMAGSAEEAISLIKENQPDVVFLDIQLPGINGVEFAEFLNKMNPNPRIVFVSAYDDYALKAFKVEAVDYLMKPVNPVRLGMTIQRLEKLCGKDEALDKLPIKDGEVVELVDFDDVMYIEASNKKILVHADSKIFNVYHHNLSDLERELPGFFMRVHKSFIVNLKKAKQLAPWFGRSYLLVLCDGSQVPVSKNLVREIKNKLHL